MKKKLPSPFLTAVTGAAIISAGGIAGAQAANKPPVFCEEERSYPQYELRGCEPQDRSREEQPNGPYSS